MRTAVPGTSFDSSQGWLNHVALISPVSSATRAVRIFSRPRRRLVVDADDAFDDGLVVAEEIADPFRRNGLLVPARPLPQQISDRHEAELPEPTRDRRADPLERLDRGVEPAQAEALTSAAATARAPPTLRSRPAALYV